MGEICGNIDFCDSFWEYGNVVRVQKNVKFARIGVVLCGIYVDRGREKRHTFPNRICVDIGKTLSC